MRGYFCECIKKSYDSSVGNSQLSSDSNCFAGLNNLLAQMLVSKRARHLVVCSLALSDAVPSTLTSPTCQELFDTVATICTHRQVRCMEAFFQELIVLQHPCRDQLLLQIHQSSCTEVNPILFCLRCRHLFTDKDLGHHISYDRRGRNHVTLTEHAELAYIDLVIFPGPKFLRAIFQTLCESRSSCEIVMFHHKPALKTETKIV